MSEQEVEVVEGVTEGPTFKDLEPGNHTVCIHGVFKTNRDGWYCLARGVNDSRGGHGCLNVVTEEKRQFLEEHFLGNPKSALPVRCSVAGQLYLPRPKDPDKE